MSLHGDEHGDRCPKCGQSPDDFGKMDGFGCFLVLLGFALVLVAMRAESIAELFVGK